MSTQREAKFRVRLDLAGAKAALTELTTHGVSAAGAVSRKLTGMAAGAAKTAVWGAGFGGAYAAIKGPTMGGVGDVVGEAFGGYGKQLEMWALGDMGQQARADRAAREETIQAFGMIAGNQNRIPPGAKAYFDSVRSLRFEQEKGADLINASSDFRSTNPEDLVKRIMDALGQLISDGVTKLAELLNPLDGR